jgi:lipid A 3-O-deacylase
MNLVRTSSIVHAAAALGALLWGAPAALSESLSVDEVRLGLLAHNVEPSNVEDGVDFSLEVLLRRSSYAYDSTFLNVVLRPRVHLGVSVNLEGETSQLYAGLTWDAKLAPRLSLELSFGGALHNGPTGDGHEDSYGCSLNFRESVSLGYAIDDRWTVYGTVAHMSNADLCDYNTGITSVGLRLGYKLQ